MVKLFQRNKKKAAPAEATGSVRAPRRPRKKKKGGLFTRILLVLILLGLLLCVVAGVVVLSWVSGIAKDLPEVTADDLVPAQTSFIYDMDGELIGKVNSGENRTIVELDYMSDYLKDGYVATEDVRFYKHSGVDIIGVGRAIWIDAIASLKAGELKFVQGASTITMQLVRNAILEDNEKRMERKITEALVALRFEKDYDKDEILELYLNEIYLAPGTYGVEAAADYYFGTNAKDISLSQAALLVGITRNPGTYSPYKYPEKALNVRNTVLNNLHKYDPKTYTKAIIDEAKAEPLGLLETPNAANSGADMQYGWFIDYATAQAAALLVEQGESANYLYSAGLHVYTTMDTDLQDMMDEAFANPENWAKSTTGYQIDGGMAMTDQSTGAVRGLVGGREYATRRGYNRATDLKRSSGSTIKPIVVYGPAVELGYGSGTAINDSPVTWIMDDGTEYTPGNFDNNWRGWISMRRALASSVNLPAVKMLLTIGTDVGWSYGVKVGLPLVASDNVISLALGGLTYGVSPLDMAGAYNAYANGGIYNELYCIEKIVDANGNLVYQHKPEPEQVVSPATAYIVTDMMTTTTRSGTGTKAAISGWQVASKTGTTQLSHPVFMTNKEDYDAYMEDPTLFEEPVVPEYISGYNDAWFVGYTTELVGVVWIGYDKVADEAGNPQYLDKANGGGGTYPAKIWKEVMMNYIAHEGLSGTSFSKPDDVVSVLVDTKSGLLANSTTPAEYQAYELYRKGYEPTEYSYIWQSVKVCSETGMIASSKCRSTSYAYRMINTTGVELSPETQDYNLYIDSAPCTTHGGHAIGGQGGYGSEYDSLGSGAIVSSYVDRSTGETMVGVYVCDHSLHGDDEYLANLSGGGYDGGCPEKYVELKYFKLGTQPDDYCDISSHKLERSSSRYDDDDDDDAASSTPTVDPDAPNTPYGVAALVIPDGTLLSWMADDNDSSDIIYVISRTDEDGNEVKYTVGYEEFIYIDTEVKAGKTYTYRVYAYDQEKGKTSNWSESASASF
ncbi:MAG: PBP1A family penicillin-binding protein [Firmicutes bacterium]|nr:PBP1A family penicillin-binding protein [Bacillota bacterium]